MTPREVIEQRARRIYGTDMREHERINTHRLHKGCDYQGRWPQAAESATEVGAEEDRDPQEGFGVIEIGFYCLIGAIVLVAIAVRLPAWLA